jgi:F0F1-type ATP synthase assembly protein I
MAMTNPERRSLRPRALHVALGMSMLCWDLAVPMVSAAVLGRMLDGRYQAGPFVTLALLLSGLMVGAYNVWRQLRLESRLDRRIRLQAHRQDGAE